MKIFEIAIYDIGEKYSKHPNKSFYTHFKAKDYNQAYEFGVIMAFSSEENTKKMLTLGNIESLSRCCYFKILKYYLVLKYTILV